MAIYNLCHISQKLFNYITFILSINHYQSEECIECGRSPDYDRRPHVQGCRTAWARMRAHELLDVMWETGPLNRKQAYVLVQELTGLPASRAHIGLLAKAPCQDLILKLKDIDPAQWLKDYRARKKCGR